MAPPPDAAPAAHAPGRAVFPFVDVLQKTIPQRRGSRFHFREMVNAAAQAGIQGGKLSKSKMSVDRHYSAIAALVIAYAVICALPSPISAAEHKARPMASASALSVQPGTLVRWSVPGTTRCRMRARSWAPIGDTCYFPIDLEQKPGVVTVVRRGESRSESGRVAVEGRAHGTQALQLADIPQANPSAADLKRNERERVLLAKIFAR